MAVPCLASDLLGKAVIVNFWNSWCVPCQDELPALHRFADLHRDDPDVALLGIVRDDTKDAVRAYVAAEGIDWKIAMDPGARAALAYGTRGQPETFAITPERVHRGRADRSDDRRRSRDDARGRSRARTMRRAAWVLLAIVVAGAIAWAAWPDGGARTERERARDLAAELRCPDCEGLSVADSSSSSAQAIRADLRRRIRAGQSDEAIRQSYVDRFGESILLNPEGEGLGVLVWGLPVLVLVIGAGGLVIALRRWHRQPAMHATARRELVQRRGASSRAERAAAVGIPTAAERPTERRG